MSSRDEMWREEEQDAFSRCQGDPVYVFVNPFECGVDPFMWRDLN